METIFEVIVMGFIADFIGVNVRYYFYKLIGKEKTREYLKGNDETGINNASQSFSNIVVGIAAFLFLIIGIAKIVDCIY